MRLRSIALCLLTQGAAASDALARVDGVLAWLAGNATAPAHWPIRSRDDVKSKNWKHLGGGNVKDVYETKVDGKRVVVKTRLTSAAHQDRVEADARGELLYLEFLRDLPGVPRLHGGWLQDHKLWYVVQFAGENFGLGKGTKRRPTRVNRGWAALVKKDPMGAARALLECCRSFADRGYFLTDFIASQFAVKGSTVSLIDAPPALSGPMVARGVPRVALVPAWRITAETFVSLHAIELLQLRGVDGVGRPKFDFHTGSSRRTRRGRARRTATAPTASAGTAAARPGTRARSARRTLSAGARPRPGGGASRGRARSSPRRRTSSTSRRRPGPCPTSTAPRAATTGVDWRR